MPEISIRLDSLSQLYDSLDPAPFREKSLDRDAEAYLLECAGEFPDGATLRLQVHGPPDLAGHIGEITQAVHGHFALLAEQSQRRWRRHMRLARGVVAAGVVVLALSLLLRELIATHPFAGADLLGEGLLILGWVALWRPVEQVLFDRYEHRHHRALVQRLASIPVRFRDEPGRGVARG